MNRRPDAPDPLSPEERELAERLLRLGPNDGPSPALDARILAAAHAAVAQQPPRLRARERKTRWPVWIGVAASLSLAMGIAWQLRPAAPQFEAVREEPDAVLARAQVEPAADAAADSAAAADAMVAAPMPVEAAPAQAAQVAAAPAEAVAAEAVPTEAADAAAAGAVAEHAAPAPNRPAAAGIAAEAAPAPPQSSQSGPAAQRSRAEPAPAAQPFAAPPAGASAPRELRRAEKRTNEYELKAAPAMAPPPAPPPPPALSAPMPAMSAPAPVDIEAARPVAPPAANAAKPRAAAKARQDAPPGDAVAAPGKAEADALRAESQAAPAAASRSAESLDRIEVTGSRIVDDRPSETGLSASDWLERVRAYRDAGQHDLARDSLQRFRRAHPQARVPDDLRALLK